MSKVIFITQNRYGVIDRLPELAKIINEKKDYWVKTTHEIAHGLSSIVWYHATKAESNLSAITIHFSRAIQIHVEFSKIQYIQTDPRGKRTIENNEVLKLNVYDSFPSDTRKRITVFLNEQEKELKKELNHNKYLQKKLKEIK